MIIIDWDICAFPSFIDKTVDSPICEEETLHTDLEVFIVDTS